jgi:DNA-binding MarR family transcriptional regulator
MVKSFDEFVKMTENGFLIGALSLIISQALQKRAYERMVAAGFDDIRPSHTIVFQYLSPEGDRLTDLAERAETSKQAMGYLVDYLVQHRYLERVPDPQDRRAQIVRRTARGWALNQAAWRIVQEIQDEWAVLVGEDDMNQMIASMRRLVARLGYEYRGSVPQISANDPQGGGDGSTL